MKFDPPAVMQRLADAVLGTEPRLRRRVRQALLAVPTLGVGLLLLYYAVGRGLVNSAAADWLAAAVVLGTVAFYALVRSRLSERFADPSLVLGQLGFANAAVLGAYALGSSTRSATLLLLPVVMSFGVSRVTPRQAWQLSGFTLALLGTVSVVSSIVDAERLSPRVEALNIGITAIVMPTLSALAAQAHGARSRRRAQRARLQEALARVAELALRDGLTGLPNRRCLEQRLEEELARQGRTGSPLCAVVIDLDHFKRVNDVHGHAAGDWTLQQFARLASGVLRSTDVLGRWGGEEFLLLLPDTDLGAGCALLERLITHLRAPEGWQAHPPWQVTVSAGLAEYRPGETAAALIDRADSRLYAAKAAGRDRMAWT